MNKSLLYVLARTGLFCKSMLDDLMDGQQLVRCVCPVHEGADNPTGFVLTTKHWFCNTRGCHRAYGKNLEGLIVALAHRYGGANLRFREARTWVTKNIALLRETFDGWPTVRMRPSFQTTLNTFSCSRLTVRESLLIPSAYFVARGFDQLILRMYDIGEPRRGPFNALQNWAIVPLYDVQDAGKCVGYAARNTNVMRPEPRWRFSANFPNNQRLFNYKLACEKNKESGQLILVEGVPDALRCIEAGFSQTVAVLGSGLYDEQMEHLGKMRLEDVVVVSDNDAAGEKFASEVKRRFGIGRTVKPPSQFKDIGDLSAAQAQEFLSADGTFLVLDNPDFRSRFFPPTRKPTWKSEGVQSVSGPAPSPAS